MRYFALRTEGRDRLLSAGIDSADTDARLLLADAAGLSVAELLGCLPDEADAGTEERFFSMIARRAAREPLQYVAGKAPFYGRDFLVGPGVLIPRFDTETLIETVLAYLKPGMDILDLCTGSGCVLLTLLLEGPQGVNGTGTDISKDALAYAKKNADAFGISPAFYEGDLFYALKDAGAFCTPEGSDGKPEELPKEKDNEKEGVPSANNYDIIKFNVITANPPYISSMDMEDLEPEVRCHEPEKALFGGEDGLDLYRRICEEAPGYLLPGGLLAVEIGWDQGPAVKQLMEKNGFRNVQIAADAAGRDRVVHGEMHV